MPEYMLGTEVTDSFKRRGWYPASGELFFDGRYERQTTHPHLHMRVNGQGTVREGRDVRIAVTMLAWSDGRQGRGGGGTTFIRDGEVTRRDWKLFMARCNGNMADELAWVMDYFVNG